MASIDLALTLVMILGTFCLGLALGAMIENRHFKLTRMNLTLEDLESKLTNLIGDMSYYDSTMLSHRDAILRLQQELEWMEAEEISNPGVTQELPAVKKTWKDDYDPMED